MDTNDLKRLAGIVDSRGKPTHMEPVNRSRITAKPGTEDWFKQMFPINDLQMPVGFRGRKNIRNLSTVLIQKDSVRKPTV